MINIKLLEYALASIGRRKAKYIFIFVIFTILISVSMVMFTISGALKREVVYSVNNLPDIIVQKLVGGRQQYIDKSAAENIVIMPGVISATPRVWGYYPFEYLNTNLTIVGIDIYDPYMSATISEIIDSTDKNTLKDKGNIVVGRELRDVIKQIYNKEEFSFQQPDGEYLTLKIAGTFKPQSAMISADTIIAEMSIAADILNIPEGRATDIAVNVGNPQEISTVAEKITNLSPTFKAITKEVIIASYQNMFDYKGGIFLLFFISCMLTFFMIVFDRLSGLSGEEAKEIAILKAIGWATGDVLKVKIYESVIVATLAFLTSIAASLYYVYILQAPGLKNIFMGYAYIKPHFTLVFSMDLSVLIVIFLLTVPVFIAAVIIPSWRAAVTDPGEVIR